MKLLVVIPLCDYEPFSVTVWNRRATHYIVKRCLTSFQKNTQTPLDLYLLADRCTNRFVHMAERALARLHPVVVDNSRIDYGLKRTALPEKAQHIVNQFFKAMELAESYDILYFCEQDYLFKKDALDHAMWAFQEIPDVKILSMFDHPGRHDPRTESEYGRHRYYRTRSSTWKSVSSTNGNFLWRVSLVREKWDWLMAEYKAGALDWRITNGLYKQGYLLLSPVQSLIQHYRLDGTNASPTFGPCPRLALTSQVGRAMARWSGMLRHMNSWANS